MNDKPSTVADRLVPLRIQAEVRNHWLSERLDSLLPELMTREGFDLWIVAAREYNEDPVIMTLLPEPAMAARRRTILLFSRRPDGSVERLTLDRYGYGDLYQRAWDPDRESQWNCLTRLVRERDPKRIGLNVSREFAFGDGLTLAEFYNLKSALGPDLMNRTASAERLCIGWLERRIEPELLAYSSLIEIGHALIAQAFSTRLIQPGETTTQDVVWWFRQTLHDLGLRAWFQPTVEIQSPGHSFEAASRELIQPGDLLHCDMGFIEMGLATDHQQHAYVLRPGEDAAPPGLVAALAEGNRLQDILLAEMRVGRTGNEVLHAALDRARAEGLDPQIYTHPLGYYGHAAGPTIGLWDQQGGVPGKGDYPLYDDTVYAIELNIKKPVPEWDGQVVRIALEEDAALTGGQMRWLSGRQTAFHLIG
jgi:hypothetical protein